MREDGRDCWKEWTWNKGITIEPQKDELMTERFNERNDKYTSK